MNKQDKRIRTLAHGVDIQKFNAVGTVPKALQNSHKNAALSMKHLLKMVQKRLEAVPQDPDEILKDPKTLFDAVSTLVGQALACHAVACLLEPSSQNISDAPLETPSKAPQETDWGDTPEGMEAKRRIIQDLKEKMPLQHDIANKGIASGLSPDLAARSIAIILEMLPEEILKVAGENTPPTKEAVLEDPQRTTEGVFDLLKLVAYAHAVSQVLAEDSQEDIGTIVLPASMAPVVGPKPPRGES